MKIIFLIVLNIGEKSNKQNRDKHTNDNNEKNNDYINLKNKTSNNFHNSNKQNNNKNVFLNFSLEEYSEKNNILDDKGNLEDQVLLYQKSLTNDLIKDKKIINSKSLNNGPYKKLINNSNFVLENLDSKLNCSINEGLKIRKSSLDKIRYGNEKLMDFLDYNNPNIIFKDKNKKKNRFLSDKHNNLTNNSPTISFKKIKIPLRNKIKEKLKNVRNKLKLKDSIKFRKSTEIINNIYNSIFFRNKVFNNPDEFYFKELKILMKTGLEEEVKKEAVKINSIIIKVLRLNRFSDNFFFDEKKNVLQIKKINKKKSDSMNFKLDVPFMDLKF